MSDSSMTPKESLAVITSVIAEARQRQEENGIVYIVWGILIAVVSMVDFWLRTQGMYDLIFVPYLVVPFGGLWSFLYYRNKGKGQPVRQNLVGRILKILWLIAGGNMMILGFVFANELGPHLIPFMLILIGTALSMSGATLRYRILLYAGILANVAGMVTFFLPGEYHVLVMAGVSIVSVFVPGLSLWSASKQRQAHV